MNRIVFAFLALTVCVSPRATAIAFFASAQASDSASKPEKMEDVNAAVTAARTATKEKRYGDAETLMLKVTSSRPELIIPRLELGLAQLGLKKYPEAENSFKIALGIDSTSQQRAHSDDFYQPSDSPGAIAPTATRQSRNTVGSAANTGQKRPPEVIGTGYASLGEVYIREGKVAEAQAAFDTAVQSNPNQAAFYLGNETLLFFQAGNTDAQLASAEKAIAVDPKRATPYYFKGQALTTKATIDPQTQKLVLPPGCVDAYHKYLELEPNGQFAADAKGVLTAAAGQAR